MPFYTGAATNFESLHGVINTVLTANGWTQDGNVLYKGNVYVRLASLDSSYLRVYGGTGHLRMVQLPHHEQSAQGGRPGDCAGIRCDRDYRPGRGRNGGCDCLRPALCLGPRHPYDRQNRYRRAGLEGIPAAGAAVLRLGDQLPGPV